MLGRVINLIKGHRLAQVLLLALFAAVAADTAYYLKVCMPVGAQVDALESRLKELDDLNHRASSDIRQYERFIQGRQQLEEFKSMLASRADYTDVLKKVYSLAKKDNMNFTSFAAQTSALRQVGGLEQLSFSLPVSGNYPDIRRFLYDVETSELFLNIDNLGLTSGSGGGIALTIGLSTYVRS